MLLLKAKRKNRKLIEIFYFWNGDIGAVIAKKRLNDINAQPKVFQSYFSIK